MICPHCGKEIADGSKFCAECGKAIDEAPVVDVPAPVTPKAPLEFHKVGLTVPAVEFTLNKGDSIYTQSGGMVWQTEGVSMTTNTKGGLMKGLGRVLAGESLFMATYTAERDGVTVAFGSTVPGDIIPFDLTGTPGIIAQKRAFLCAENGVDVSIAFTKRVSAGLFGGEGFILQDIKGNGHVFLEIDGDQIIKDLAPGEVLKVDTGNVVAFDKSVSYEIETVKGFSNIIFGGEGLFLTKLTGPGRVVLQTQNFLDFARRVGSMLPTKGN
ncbi:MAG: TIGR00266 family protein [Clostridia bacterium]|nr:TIGR00266 family protein [Clostridia bacterium]